MRTSSDIWWLFGAALASIGLAPLIVSGNADSNARRQQSREIIAAMTPAERQRLDDSYQRFRQLPPQQQANWAAFHQQLEIDRRENPSVIKALDAYAEWIPTLSPFDIDGLKNETNTEQRVALIASIQQQKEDASRTPGGGRLRGPHFWSMIPTDDFYRIMRIVERQASGFLSSDEMAELAALPEDTPGHALALVQKLRSKNQTFATVVNSSVFQEILDSFADRKGAEEGLSRIERMFSGRGPGPSPSTPEQRQERRRWVVRQQLSNKLLSELFLDAMKSPPTDEQLIAKLKSLPEKERIQFYSRAADEMKILLRIAVFHDRQGERDETVPAFFEAAPLNSFNRPGEGRRGGRDRDRGPGGPENRPPDDGQPPPPP